MGSLLAFLCGDGVVRADCLISFWRRKTWHILWEQKNNNNHNASNKSILWRDTLLNMVKWLSLELQLASHLINRSCNFLSLRSIWLDQYCALLMHNRFISNSSNDYIFSFTQCSEKKQKLMYFTDNSDCALTSSACALRAKMLYEHTFEQDSLRFVQQIILYEFLIQFMPQVKMKGKKNNNCTSISSSQKRKCNNKIPTMKNYMLRTHT